MKEPHPEHKNQTRAQKRQARKRTQAEQLALEKQLVKEGKILPRTRYVARGYLGRIFAVMLAFLFGMLVVIGGLLGGGYYLAVTPSRNLFHVLGLNEELLSEEYLDRSVIDIAVSIRDDINSLADPASVSLGTFSKYTPVVGKMIDSIVEQVRDYGIDADAETLTATPLGGLADYLMNDIVMTAQLGGLMQVSADGEPLMLALCYGIEGSNEENGDYQIVGGEVVMNEGKSARTLKDLIDNANGIIGGLPIESVLAVDASSTQVMRALSYGTEGVNYTVNDRGEIEMLTDPLTGKPYPKRTIEDLTNDQSLIENVTIGDIVTVDENTTGILLAIKDWTVGDLTSAARIESLRLSQIVTIDDASSPILQAMRDWRIADLTDADMVDSLLLGDIIEIGEHSAQLLRALADTAIGDLSTAIDTLRLQDILGEAALESNNILKNLKQSSLETLADDVASLTVAQVFGEELYSYLDLSNGKSYETLVNGYDPQDKSMNTAEDVEDPNAAVNQNRPNAMDLTGKAVKETRRTQDGDEVFFGYFRTKDEIGAPAGALVQDADVHRRVAVSPADPDLPDGETVRTMAYYTNVEADILPQTYEWRVFDYDVSAKSMALPEGDSVVTDIPAGYAEQPARSGADLYTDADGNAYYYLTARVHLRGGAPAVEKVAYPLCTDDAGIYYCRYELGSTTAEDGTVSFDDHSTYARVDLERTVSAYVYEDGTPVVFQTAEDGTVDPSRVVYGEGETAQTVRFRHRAAGTRLVAVTDPATGEPVLDENGDRVMREEEVTERWWIVVESPVEGGYYTVSGDTIERVQGETSLTWTVGDDADGDGVIDEGAATVQADRYLSGVWYLLFGRELCDGTAEGGCTHRQDGAPTGSSHVVLVDNTHMPVLDIAGTVTEVSNIIDTLPLWEMWLHELIGTNPYAELPIDYEVNGVTYVNLNELTVSGAIGCMKAMIAQFEAQTP